LPKRAAFADDDIGALSPCHRARTVKLLVECPKIAFGAIGRGGAEMGRAFRPPKRKIALAIGAVDQAHIGAVVGGVAA
jgi:hypothetical protein